MIAKFLCPTSFEVVVKVEYVLRGDNTIFVLDTEHTAGPEPLLTHVGDGIRPTVHTWVCPGCMRTYQNEARGWRFIHDKVPFVVQREKN